MPADKAQGATEAALDFLKEKLPAGMGEKIESYLAGNAESIGGMASVLGDQAKKVFGR